MYLNNKNMLKYVSDLHLEYKSLNHPQISFLWNNKSTNIQNRNQYLALIGDIGNPFKDDFLEFFKRCSLNYDKIMYVPGNHEYWNLDNNMRTYSGVNDKLQNICGKFSNVILLDNDIYDLDGIKIIGSTLWSRTSDDNKDYEKLVKNYYKMYNDNFLAITIDDTNKWNDTAIKFIEREIETSQPCILLTHYAPIFCDPIKNQYTSDPKFFGTKTYEAYHNDLRYLVKKPIRAWLYGHTHYSSTFYIDDVMISTNQLGYNDSVNFDSGKYIDLVKIKDDNTKS